MNKMHQESPRQKYKANVNVSCQMPVWLLNVDLDEMISKEADGWAMA
jgi:hypothetical protein